MHAATMAKKGVVFIGKCITHCDFVEGIQQNMLAHGET